MRRINMIIFLILWLIPLFVYFKVGRKEIVKGEIYFEEHKQIFIFILVGIIPLFNIAMIIMWYAEIFFNKYDPTDAAKKILFIKDDKKEIK
jgi:hypothetical protein